MGDMGIYQGTVRVFGGAHEEGEELTECRVTTSGDTVKLAKWYDPRGIFRQVDFLDEVKVTSKAGKVIFTGLSRQMREEIGLDGKDAEARWEMVEQGCKGCR